ncbi:Adaptin ear-binding coat-associated protein 1, partial [Cucurbita argyrosperma subsp. sororia]
MEEKQQKTAKDQERQEDHEENEAIELVLFQVSECYVYLIPPRKSAASYRADEWDVNKWAWEGKLKVLSKGEECIIRLEDKATGELYARAFLREGEQHPVETVIDSSRYFVLRIEENIGGRLRHAFIGIGFRERTEAYDFQAALHDHMKYLNKKKSAEEMEQQFQKTSSVDYSLKDGETIVLQFKSKKSTSNIKKPSELDVKVSPPEEEGNTKKESIFCIKPPPPPPALLSPVAAQKSPTNVPPNINLDDPSKHKLAEPAKEDSNDAEGQSTLDLPDDDFGNFQAAE